MTEAQEAEVLRIARRRGIIGDDGLATAEGVVSFVRRIQPQMGYSPDVTEVLLAAGERVPLRAKILLRLHYLMTGEKR